MVARSSERLVRRHFDSTSLEIFAMTPDKIKLYHSSGSPNSRRVRIFLAEKGMSIPQVPVDLGKGEQHSEAYRAINSRRGACRLRAEDKNETDD